MPKAKLALLFLGDIAILYGALALTLLVRYRGDQFAARFDTHFLPFSVLFLIWLLAFWIFDLYRQRIFISYNELAQRVLASVGAAVLTSITLFYLFEGFFRLTPKTNLAIFAIIVAAASYFFRSAVLAFTKFRPEAALMIGSSPEIHELMAYLREHRHTGFEAAEWFKALDAEHIKDLPAAIERTGARTIIIQPAIAKDPKAVRALYDLLPLGLTVINFADFYELVFERVPLEELEEGWFIEHIVTRRPAYDRAKELVDFLLASILFILLLPLTVLIALLIRLTSKGPAIFAQNRVGKNDAVFPLYKFRTMVTWQGGLDGTPAWTEKNDPRVTGFGRFLRRTHLDEIPQLWNIIRGDISFTGPRPERVELAEQYREFPYYNIRHMVKPGLTGWAQINYRPSASLDEAREKLKFDIFYVKNRSFILDLAIILKTIKYVFTVAE